MNSVRADTGFPLPHILGTPGGSHPRACPARAPQPGRALASANWPCPSIGVSQRSGIWLAPFLHQVTKMVEAGPHYPSTPGLGGKGQEPQGERPAWLARTLGCVFRRPAPGARPDLAIGGLMATLVWGKRPRPMGAWLAIPPCSGMVAPTKGKAVRPQGGSSPKDQMEGRTSCPRTSPG